MDIENSISDKYKDYIENETDDLELTVEEALHIVKYNEDYCYNDELLFLACRIISKEFEELVACCEALTNLLQNGKEVIEDGK